ncbi:MAG: isochorismate synthase [Balneolales bacterium]
MPEHTEKVSSEAVSFMETLVDSDRFARFFEQHRPQSDSGYLTLCIPFENMDPLAVLELNGHTGGTRFYWERPEYEMAIAAGGRVQLIKSTSSDRFRSISKRSNALLAKTRYFSEMNHSMAGAHLVGGFSFFDHPLSGSWRSLGNAAFFLPEWLLVRDGQFSILNITCKWTPELTFDALQEWFARWTDDFIRRLNSNLENSHVLQRTQKPDKYITPLETEADRTRWMANVEKARHYIREHSFQKIVLARELKLHTDHKVSCTKLIHYLRNEYPSCYTFLFQLNGEAAFLGSTPEKLLSLQSQYVKTEALAGSISRGKTAAQDALFEKKLRESSKDREEHAYVLASIRDKLHRLTDALEYPDLPIIKKYANVQHLCTPMAASLVSEMNPVEILSRLHPTPAVGGYPELEAVPHIQELEQLERGWYAGPVGWFNTNRRAEFSVAIRSGLIRRNQVRFFAGCGIVEDSDPATEWEETRIKLLPMQKGLEYAID